MKKNETETVSAGELASLLLVSRKTVAEWAALGIVVRVGHGRYDLRGSVKGFARHMRERNRGGDAAAVSSVAQQRSRLLGLQADRVQIELDRVSTEMVPRSEVTAQWSRRFAGIRRTIMAWPSSIAYLENRETVTGWTPTRGNC
jgi:phage terminase Nu1 subunit (DNA packaging protein)